MIYPYNCYNWKNKYVYVYFPEPNGNICEQWLLRREGLRTERFLLYLLYPSAWFEHYCTVDIYYLWQATVFNKHWYLKIHATIIPSIITKGARVTLALKCHVAQTNPANRITSEIPRFSLRFPPNQIKSTILYAFCINLLKVIRLRNSKCKQTH